MRLSFAIPLYGCSTHHLCSNYSTQVPRFFHTSTAFTPHLCPARSTQVWNKRAKRGFATLSTSMDFQQFFLLFCYLIEEHVKWGLIER